MTIIRLIIGTVILCIIGFLIGRWLFEEPYKQPQPVSKVYSLPEKYSLLKNKFGEFVVMVDTTDIMPDSSTIQKFDRGYMMTLKTIRATAYILKSKLRDIGPTSITFNIKDAEISNDSSALVKLAYQIDSTKNYERIQEQQKQL